MRPLIRLVGIIATLVVILVAAIALLVFILISGPTVMMLKGMVESAGTYLAMLTTSSEMPIGYRRVKEKGSFHILEGRW